MPILILEDDPAIRAGLEQLLTSAGYAVAAAANIREALALVGGGTVYGAFLLDVMLPDGSGIALAKQLRRVTDAPVLLLTALDDEESVIAGLSAGADDYIAKPFRARELLARLQANLRRNPVGGVSKKSGDLLYRRPEEVFFLRDEPQRLPKNARRLLTVLLESGGRLLTRDHLFYAVWDKDENFVEENTLSVEISRLRRLLGTFDGRDYIETVRGVGYRWALPVLTEGLKGGERK